MKTIFRLVWNSEAHAWVLAPETAKRHTKGSSVSKLVAALVATSAAVASLVDSAVAQTVALPIFDPTVNDNLVGSTVVSGGATVTLQGSATQITPGITGRSIISLPNLYAAGLTTDPRANPADPASLVINTGARSQILTLSDPITGGTTNIAVFDNANIVDTRAASADGIGYTVPLNGPTNGQQYISARIGEVDATGGTLNVAIGSLAAPTNSAANFINMGMAKQTSLFFANGTGAAPSTVVWQGSNLVDMGSALGAINASGPGPAQSTGSFEFFSYVGTFTALDGSSRTVNNAADLQAYNAFLIAQLRNGALNPNQYEAEFDRAFTSARAPITYTNGPPLPDEGYEPIGMRAVIHADGANAQGIIAAGARLDAFIVSNISPGITSGGMAATNGGTVFNNGQLSFRRGGYDVGAAMAIGTGGHGINNGVLNAGFVSGLDGAVDPSVPVFEVSTIGAYVTGAGSTFANNAGGIVNVAGSGSRGVEMLSNGSGTNAGTINVGVVSVASTTAGARTEGARVTSGAQFTNLAGGLIYLGRQPQYADAAAVPDVANNATPLAGIIILNTGAATNAGTITIGTLTQGSAGIFASGSTGAVINSGTINVNGAASANPTQNQGINVEGGTNVTNSGTINVNGVNGIGLRLFSGNTTRATSSGTMNVAGGIGPTGLRNYGIWSEGNNSLATLSGNVNLSGVGAIGVHARGGGDVNITGAGNVNFVNGSNQIGYFMFGAGSTINYSGTAGQNVSTTDSTLFRVEDGAVFNGGTSGAAFTASGTGSIAFDITGAPSTFSSGNMTLNLSGQGAKGVLIEGGAVGTITNTATINQTGAGSVAGIVDGQKHGLDGSPVGAPNASTSLNSAATLTSALDNVIGYIARNQGQLTNSGSLNFTGAHTTGIQVETGATATNSARISITGGGTGIFVSGPAGGRATTANNSSTITVNGGNTPDRTRGVVADGTQAVANMQTGSTLDLTGVGAIGAEALDGGHVTVAGTATPVFGNTDQIAFHALGAGSTVSSTATVLNATGVRSTLFRIEDGATLTTSSALAASGQGSAAIVSTGPGALAALTGGSLNITGADARGIVVEGGATGSIAAGTAVTLTGASAVVGVADGQKHDLSGAPVGAPNPATTLTNQASMSLSGPGALAFIAQNQGTLVNQGRIAMAGAGATGVHVLSGGVLDNQADISVAKGTGINMEGANSLVRNSATVLASDGVAALHVHDGGGGVVGGSFVSDGSAHTILVGSGATGLNASGVTLTSNGVGNGIENAAETGAITLANTTINVGSGAGIRTATALDPASSVTVNVSGAGTGLAFQTATGALTSGRLDLGSGYAIAGNGAGATGILANTAGAVTSAANVTMNNAAAGAALVAGTASSSLNAGVLKSSSTVSPVVDLSNGSGTTFTNQGTVYAIDVAHHAILGSAGNDTVNMRAGAVQGVVAMGAGADSVNWSGGSLNGSIEMGAGSNEALKVAGVDLSTTYHLDGGTGSNKTLTLEGIQHKGGTFAADNLTKGVNLGQNWGTINFHNGANFTLTDKLSLGGSTVNIDATSQVNAGAGVLSVIRSIQANDPVTVNNAGTLSLVNGASGPTDRLIIVGNYVGQNGRLAIDSVLNEGEPNSVSDMMVLDGSNGGARASGRTAVNVNYQGGGALTTGNGIRVVDTVSGATTDAGSFVLGGRVAAGAYEYVLEQGGRASTGGNPGDQNWYLRNTINIADSPPPPVERPNYRVEVPLDMVVPVMANRFGLALLGTYHDRVGEDHGDALKPREPAGPALGKDGLGSWGWARVFGENGDTGYEGGTRLGRFSSFLENGPSYDYKVAGLQAGIDVHRQVREDGSRDMVGVTVGAGRIDTDVQAVFGGKAGFAYAEGGAFGGYWTRKGATGWYIDGVAQALRYGRIRTSSVLGENLDTTGWGALASLEGGYPFSLDNGWTVEPQAQLVYQHTSISNNLRDHFGLIQYGDTDALYGRLGARLTKNWNSDSGRPITGWARANVWHHFGSDASTTFAATSGLNPVTLTTDLGGTWGQLGVGISARVAQNTSAFASIDYNAAFGGGKGSSVSARAGFRVVW
ncbi:autotransporter outer membrane beta-barrel domain-containing protein [Variovorax sp. J31P207]|uniref:autotransporter outer membrane beta-barrel domain-containing protein n=1 Tax=Variovorax sp. J31P207 TaxID=3053510 RepID=UPI002576630A|nr:autotransporter outer membrane beta-barrel domain-containing protein [Variovorax sp. J31P207]MDM0070563.1 autotransporter outer membrane beta-barrel domain-containing protein [Variovorax sp. J31P207]